MQIIFLSSVLINRYYKTFITSGSSGIAETRVKEGKDDIQVIPVRQGKPNAIAIKPGNKVGDDEFLARLAGEKPGPRDPSKDWSDTNGKNWIK